MKCEFCEIITDNLGRGYIVELCDSCSYQIITSGEISVQKQKIEAIIEGLKEVETMNEFYNDLKWEYIQSLQDLLK